MMRAIVATATEGIVAIDTSGRIETVNRAAERMFGYSPDELVGRDVTVLMPNPYRDEHATYVRSYLETGRARIIGIGREVVGLRKDGSEFPIDLSVGEGSVGDRCFFVAIIRDISDRKEMQAKLALAERLAAIGELAAGVAHEINNPINTVLNCAQLIRDGDDADENTAMILDEGQRIAGIVDDLLRFARDEPDLTQPTDISIIVQRTVRLLQRALLRSGVHLNVDVADGLPPLGVNPPRLQQVLLNLVLNAKDALLEGPAGTPPCITVQVTPQHGGVLVTVRDNGPGVPPDLGTRIFEPFLTTKRGRGGTGLGLSISKSIVDGFGGSIGVQDAPGGGADFRIWLPAAPEPPAS
ncbi:MAG: nitrogen regulation protein NR(II) [Planctomycetota bacterium]